MKITVKGLNQLRRAFRKNPDYVKRRGLQMMTRLKRAYQTEIIRSPWEVGGSGGGTPVGTGSLRDSHEYRVSPTRMTAGIPEYKAKEYGIYVHEGTSLMDARPWLDYAHEKLESDREKAFKRFLGDVVNNLAE